MFHQVTQNDVAKAANVSRSTVSLVINGKDSGRIPLETRRRVLKAVRELGYAPNLAARMLVQKSNKVIGLFTYEQFFPYERDDFFYPFVLGVERAASREGYNLLLFTRSDGETSRGIYREDGNILNMVDGAILMGVRPDPEEIRRLVKDERPFVYIGRREIEGCQFDWVSSDYRQGARDVVKHLIARGHRQLAYVGNIRDNRPFDMDRIAGYRDAAGEAADIQVDVSLLDEPNDWLAEFGHRAPSALVCNGNETLAKALRYLTRRGLRVPDDISLASLGDDSVQLPAHVEPTGIHLNRAFVGAQAFRLLIERLNNPEGPRVHRLIPCVVREGNTVRSL